MTAAPEATGRVLLVDDDPGARFLVRRGLTVAGLDLVDLDLDRPAAEEPLGGSGFDLVVLDLGSPDADGAELLVRIRRRSDVPVIVLSDRGSEDVRLRSFALGADDFVVKPFYPRELAARARAVIRRRGVGTVAERPVTEHLRRLRRKVEADPSRPRHLMTVRGHGYRFDP
jgi:DNA-binding response OmpR family regulator